LTITKMNLESVTNISTAYPDSFSYTKAPQTLTVESGIFESVPLFAWEFVV